jgi:GDPmannose 4,6-dehydratase
VEAAFDCAGIAIRWQGEGMDTLGVDRAAGRVLVRVNPKFYRPADVEILLGNSAKAERVLGWRRAIAFPELARRMAEHDLALAGQGSEAERQR